MIKFQHRRDRPRTLCRQGDDRKQRRQDLGRIGRGRQRFQIHHRIAGQTVGGASAEVGIGRQFSILNFQFSMIFYISGESLFFLAKNWIV